MWKNYLLSVLVIAVLAACGTDTTPADSGDQKTDATTQSEQKEKESKPDAETTANLFGEAITMDGSIGYGELLTQIDGKDSIEAKVMGTVTDVCQKKGCWMTVAGAEGQPDMRVRFKDYGFFVPLDISGRKVVIEGKAFREVTSVEDQRHYAEDEGLSEEEIAAITETKVETKFLAHGVILLDE